MKKGLIGICLVMGLMVVATGLVLAEEFETLDSSATIASVDLSGPGTYSWTVTVHNISDDNEVSTIGWLGVSVGQDVWKVAEQYIKIDADVTYPDWGIQIYTDNKDGDANPKYTGTASSGYNLVGVSNPTNALPFAWKVVDVSTAAPVAPVLRLDYSGFTDYCWKWMKDKSQTEEPFDNNEFYVRVWDDMGIYWHESPDEPGNPGGGATPNFVYIACWFDKSTAQEYSTNKLTLEIYSL